MDQAVVLFVACGIAFVAGYAVRETISWRRRRGARRRHEARREARERLKAIREPP
jgi:hypothetical protein